MRAKTLYSISQFLSNHIVEVNVNFPTAITTCFSKFATFSGRATRSEFWWFYLFTLLLSWFAQMAVGAGVAGVVSLALFLPLLAATVRRLHDIGRTGWWILIAFTVIGIIVLIVWYATDSEKAANQYGEYVAPTA
jgi:uncharacterized membrane protein YhaH (DUF805 family)